MNVGPWLEVVNVGITRLKVARATTVPSNAFAPCSLKRTTRDRLLPTTIDAPTTPLHTIITTANTVSRAKVAAFGPSAAMRVTIKDTSITVTTRAEPSVPYGSPSRWAISLGVTHGREHQSDVQHRHRKCDGHGQ